MNRSVYIAQTVVLGVSIITGLAGYAGIAAAGIAAYLAGLHFSNPPLKEN